MKRGNYRHWRGRRKSLLELPLSENHGWRRRLKGPLHPSLVATLETVIPKEIGPKRKSETSPLVDKPDLEEKALKELSQPRGLTHSSPYGSI
jgi:hypothetical protein